MIPEKTVMLFGEKLSDIATITVPNNNGRSWKIELKKEGDKIWFHEGLMEFLDHYSVQNFYNLYFRYEGESKFSVFVFDDLGSEIDYPRETEPPISNGLACIKREYDSENENVVTNNDVNPRNNRKDSNGKKRRRSKKRYERQAPHNSVALLTRSRSRIKSEKDFEMVEPENSGKRRVDFVEMVEPEINVVDNNVVTPRKRLVASKNSSGRQRRSMPKVVDVVEMAIPKSVDNYKVTSIATQRAIRFAATLKLKNPSFMFVLKPYTFRQGYVNVPAEFEKRHFGVRFEKIQLEAHNGERKKWPARSYYSSNGRSLSLVKRIGKGWGLFSADNKLKEGDVCVFELIKKTKMAVFRVWIYRADDYGKTKSASKRFKPN